MKDAFALWADGWRIGSAINHSPKRIYLDRKRGKLG